LESQGFRQRKPVRAKDQREAQNFDGEASEYKANACRATIEHRQGGDDDGPARQQQEESR
jgi:hypothetical protein